ncbi:MAG: DNA polymerase I [Christensenellales bacterium]|nr:DNA polymerase I [Christensenellales bacterium]
MSQPDTFVIIDGNSLMHRAFHALPPLSNADGVYTNAVFGFLSMLFKVVGDEQPRYLAVAFDLHGPTFRHKDYSEYKAGRKPTAPELRPQFDLVRECLEKMGVKILTCPTFEADDILGTFARRCEEAGIPALLVTGDRDSMQLVTKTSNVLYTRRGVSDVVRYTPEKVLEDFGVTPAQIPDLKGLMGDASDNIPGIPGIGEKTAIKLLSAYGTLENALDHAEADLKGKQREKMIDGRMSGLMSKKIATITRYVPLDDVTLEDCRLGDMRGVLPLFEQLGLKTLTVRLLQLSGLRAEENAPAAPQIAWQDERQLLSEAEISTFISALPTDARTALLMREDGVSLAAANGAQALIPFAQGLLGGGLDPLCAAKALAPLLTGARPLILWNAKRLKTEFASWGLPVTAVFDDDQIMQYLLAPQNGKYEAPENAAALLQQTLSDEHALDEQEMTKLYREIELPLLSTLYDMERDGFLVDCDELNRLGAQYDQQIAELKDEIFSLCGVAPFNLNSPQQLGSVLFDTLGLPAKKKTARGYSTDAETLNELAELHPAVDKILLYRQVAKLKSTYIDGLLRLTGRDGRIHTWFDQTIAATGRISSSEPNLQNIPVRTPMGREIRRAFIAPAGSVLVDADYSQIELRLLAHLSGDEAMCEAFTLGQDIHARTAAEVYGVPLDEVTPQMRSSAKAVNFGIVYGISDFGLASNLHISRKEAAEFISRYFARYPAIHRFMDACVSQGKAEGYSVTMYGRRRPLPELSSPNYNRRQFGERAAMNTPVQGAAADIIKIAMNAVHDELKASGLTAKLILQVHDELIVEAPEEEREQVETLLRRCMENAASLRVPLIADVHSGHSWYDTK